MARQKFPFRAADAKKAQQLAKKREAAAAATAAAAAGRAQAAAAAASALPPAPRSTTTPTSKMTVPAPAPAPAPSPAPARVTVHGNTKPLVVDVAKDMEKRWTAEADKGEVVNDVNGWDRIVKRQGRGLRPVRSPPLRRPTPGPMPGVVRSSNAAWVAVSEVRGICERQAREKAAAEAARSAAFFKALKERKAEERRVEAARRDEARRVHVEAERVRRRLQQAEAEKRLRAEADAAKAAKAEAKAEAEKQLRLQAEAKAEAEAEAERLREAEEKATLARMIDFVMATTVPKELADPEGQRSPTLPDRVEMIRGTLGLPLGLPIIPFLTEAKRQIGVELDGGVIDQVDMLMHMLDHCA